MKPHSQGFLFVYSILALLLFSTCKKDEEPDGFTADFDFTFANGGMAPDTAMFSANFQSADSYSWDISGIRGSGSNFFVLFNAAGDFDASLTVESGSFSDTKNTSVGVENFPPNGTAMTIIQGNGEIGTVVVDTENPRWLSIDTIDPGGVGGMDYDDENKTLYYTSSILRSFPNGEGQEILYTEPAQEDVLDLAVDGPDKKVYFIINSPLEGFSNISILDINTRARTDLEFLTFPMPQFIAIDKEANKYFYTGENSTGIHYNTVNGMPGSANHNDAPNYAIVFDNLSKVLYYVNDGDFDDDFDIIRVYPDNDYYEEMVVNGASMQPILGLDIDEKNQHLYWTDQEQDAIYRLKMNEPGEQPEVIFSDVTNPRALAIGNFGK